MKEIKGDYIQKPNGSWTKIKSANNKPIKKKIKDWLREIYYLIKN